MADGDESKEKKDPWWRKSVDEQKAAEYLASVRAAPPVTDVDTPYRRPDDEVVERRARGRFYFDTTSGHWIDGVTGGEVDWKNPAVSDLFFAKAVPSPTPKIQAPGETPWWLQLDEMTEQTRRETEQRKANIDAVDAWWATTARAGEPVARIEKDTAYAIEMSLRDMQSANAAAMGDLMELDVTEFTDEHCPWCYATYDGDDYAPTFHPPVMPTAPSLLPADGEACMGPCRKCLLSLKPTECKRCGRSGVTFSRDV